MADEFVEPEVVRLPLSDGRWIDVKKELTAGEHNKVFARIVKRMGTAGDGSGTISTELDAEKVGFTKLEQYIVGWSFTNGDGKPVPPSLAALMNLKAHIRREVAEAVDAHEERVNAELEAQKKQDPTGATASSAT
jgi:hypothetical protein